MFTLSIQRIRTVNTGHVLGYVQHSNEKIVIPPTIPALPIHSILTVFT